MALTLAYILSALCVAMLAGRAMERRSAPALALAIGAAGLGLGAMVLFAVAL